MEKDLKYLIQNAPSNVKEHFIYKEFKKGSNILLPNRENEYLYILIDGKAEVYSENYSGALISIYIYESYSIFGEIELFNERIITHGILAKMNCNIILVHKSIVYEWMKNDFDFTRYILEQLASKLSISSSNRLQLALLSIKDRVLYSIYTHNKIGDLDNLNKYKLSQEICAPIRSLNRSIKECIEEGFITYQNKRFHITQEDKLEEYSKIFIF